jgi:hypothetical protein
MNIDEGYYDATIVHSEDCDHGPCTGYFVKGERNQPSFIVWLYDNHPQMVSIHEEERGA